MPPKKNKRKGGNEMTADDMRRLGMSEEDISRIVSERTKSTEEKKADQEREALNRRENEFRQRVAKETAKNCEALLTTEQEARIQVLEEEDSHWNEVIPPLLADKVRVLRQYNEQEALRKVHLAKKKREEEMEKLQKEVQNLSPEERDLIVAEQRKKESERTLAMLRHVEAKKRKDERRAARLAAKRLNNGNDDNDEVSSNSDVEEENNEFSKFDHLVW